MRILFAASLFILAHAPLPATAQDLTQDLCRAGMDGPCIIDARPSVLAACAGSSDVLTWPYLRVEIVLPPITTSRLANKKAMDAALAEALPPMLQRGGFESFGILWLVDAEARWDAGWEAGDRVLLSLPFPEHAGVAYQTLEAGLTPRPSVDPEAVGFAEAVRDGAGSVDRIPVYCPEAGLQGLDEASLKGTWLIRFTPSAKDAVGYDISCPVRDAPGIEDMENPMLAIDGNGLMYGFSAVGMRDGEEVYGYSEDADSFAWRTVGGSYAVNGSLLLDVMHGFAMVVEKLEGGYLLQSLAPPGSSPAGFFFLQRCETGRDIDDVFRIARESLVMPVTPREIDLEGWRRLYIRAE